MTGILTYHLWFLQSYRGNKLYTALIDLSGNIQYVPATRRSALLSFCITDTMEQLYTYLKLWALPKYRYMAQLLGLRTGISVCYIASDLNGCARYARACGSSAKIETMAQLQRYGITQLALPSGKLKWVNSTITVLIGSILPTNSTDVRCTKGGYWRNLGRKPTVRGVVKNPVDHPHGGRARTVCKPRSPWGWYTK